MPQLDEHAYLGLGSRLAAEPSTAMADLAFAHELDGADALWDRIGHADLAHVLELIEASIVPVDAGAKLLRALLTLLDQPFDPASLDPSIGDVYNNREHRLRAIDRTLSGWLPTGRARREATTIAWQLACRDRLRTLGLANARLLTTLSDLAHEHRATVMPDYTYLQHAHPTTLGHYLLGHAGPIERHDERLRGAHSLVNQSPAGSGSVNGTALPIDRHRLAASLEFDGLVTNTRDAMWAPDMALDIAHAVVQIMVSVDRLAEELQIWATAEFGFVELADHHSRTSVIMPQKKNPYALSGLRGTARFLAPIATSLANTMMMPSGQPENRTHAYLWCPRMLDEATNAVVLLTEVLRDATFAPTIMADGAEDGFVEATDACDAMTMRHGTPNREAHRLVGRAIRVAIEDGRRSIERADLARANEELGLDLPLLSDNELAELAQPAAIIASRRTEGGAGADALQAAITTTRAHADEAAAHWSNVPSTGYAQRLIDRCTATVAEQLDS